MSNFKCDKCGKIFGLKTDLNRHLNKKYPCVFFENLKDIATQNIISQKNEDFVIDLTCSAPEPENQLYNVELKRIYNELKPELYEYVFDKLEKNKKFKLIYDDVVEKIFMKFASLCDKKPIKKNGALEYIRCYDIFDEHKKVKSSDVVKMKLYDIFNDNEKYFCKRLLKYAKNVSMEIYSIKYVDL